MDYKAVIEGQIEVLQNIQKKINEALPNQMMMENAIKLADRIGQLVVIADNLKQRPTE